jgi:hypothetical protein
MAMSACDWKDLEVATKSCILAIYFGRETHSDIRCRTLAEKDDIVKCFFLNLSPTAPYLHVCNR